MMVLLRQTNLELYGYKWNGAPTEDESYSTSGFGH